MLFLVLVSGMTLVAFSAFLMIALAEWCGASDGLKKSVRRHLFRQDV